MKTVRNTKGWSAKLENAGTTAPGVTKIHNLIIVDESGSMRWLYKAALDGMNETLSTIRTAARECPEQAQEVTFVTFDTGHYNKIFDSAPGADTRELTMRDYNPSGGTPLYDALGKALTELEPRVKENEAVLVTVITDGLENASSEYSLEEIRSLVERLDAAGWLFTYIGANQNSAEVGKSMGIADTLDFKANEEDMKTMWAEQNMARANFFEESRDCDFSPIEYERGKFFKK